MPIVRYNPGRFTDERIPLHLVVGSWRDITPSLSINPLPERDLWVVRDDDRFAIIAAVISHPDVQVEFTTHRYSIVLGGPWMTVPGGMPEPFIVPVKMPFAIRARGFVQVASAARQCQWMLADEDPDEGHWHCKHTAGHSEPHETEFGMGRDRRWKMRDPQEADDGAIDAVIYLRTCRGNISDLT